MICAVLYLAYNHDVTFTLYINWTVFFYINVQYMYITRVHYIAFYVKVFNAAWSVGLVVEQNYSWSWNLGLDKKLQFLPASVHQWNVFFIRSIQWKICFRSVRCCWCLHHCYFDLFGLLQKSVLTSVWNNHCTKS